MPTDSTASLSRRSVLRLSFFSALGLAALGVTPVIQTSQRKVLEAAFDLILGVSSAETGAIDATAAYLRLLPSKQQWQIRGLIRAVEWGPVVSTGRRFTRLETQDQERWLNQLAQSSSPIRRQIFSALKQLGAMGNYQSDSTWEKIGYPGPLLER